MRVWRFKVNVNQLSYIFILYNQADHAIFTVYKNFIVDVHFCFLPSPPPPPKRLLRKEISLSILV